MGGAHDQAAFVKRAVPSREDELSDKLALVAVFDGFDLKSRGGAFKGGSMLTRYGGIALDLSEAELAPGARLSVRTPFAGIDIKTPSGRRVESSVKALAGGVDTRRADADDPNAPALAREGMAFLGGTAVRAQHGRQTA